jgi:hypothetical protein
LSDFAHRLSRRVPQVLSIAVVLCLQTSQYAFAQSPAETPWPRDRVDLPSQTTVIPADLPPPPAAQPTDNSPAALTSGLASPIGPAAGLLDGRVGQAVPRLTYSVLGIPLQGVTGQSTRLGLVREDLTIGTPIWQCKTDEFTFNAHVHNELFQTDAILPTTGREFPETLWDVRVGTTYRHLFPNDWVTGATISVGSASDKPFHSVNEMTFGVNAFLRIPQGEHNAWLLSLSYSPTSQLSYPIPMAAFLWQPNDWFRAQIGLPFSIVYRPTEDLTIDLSYMLLTNVRAQAAYRLTPSLRLHAGYDWSNEGFYLADRADDRFRFFSYEQRVSAGAQYFLTPRMSFDLSAGYVFSRFFFEGRQLSDSNTNRVDVGDGYFIALRFLSRW